MSMLKRAFFLALIVASATLVAGASASWSQAVPDYVTPQPFTEAQSLTFASGTGQDGLAGEDITFAAPITTRYVLLRVLDNYGVDNYTGLSEVRFYARATQRWYPEGSSASVEFVTVKADDLLQTAVASVDDNLTINTENSGYTTNATYQTSDVSCLTDGTFGPAGAVGGLCIQGGTVTYNLDTSTVPGGYDISEVWVYAGWGTSGGHENPSYTLLCKRVGESDFTPVGAVYYICTITGTKNNHPSCVPQDEEPWSQRRCVPAL